MTMTLVSTVTVGSGGAASIDFSSIPQTGTDLYLVTSIRGNSGLEFNTVSIKFNNDSSSAYSWRRLLGNGSTASSSTQTTTTFMSFIAGNGAGGTSNVFSNSSYYLPNYAQSVVKSISFDGVVENNHPTGYQVMHAGLWNSTAAITSISLLPSGSSTIFDQYSTASLYTITKGSGGATVS